MATQNDNQYEFGNFRLDPAEKALTRNGEIVSLTPKAFDTLVILVEKRGRLVEKIELMNHLWPDTFVEENSLSQNVYLVRKALGEESQGSRYIETVPRRGYRFIAPVKEVSGQGRGMLEFSAQFQAEGVERVNAVDGNEAAAEISPMASVLVSPLRRLSRPLLFALAPAITLLAIWLVWSAPRRPVAGITEHPEAYQAYARGLFFWNRRTEDGLSRSIGYFNEAIAKDPRYALAWAGLADAYAVTGYLKYKFMPANEAYRKAEESATRALEIDQTMAEAHTALSIVRAYRDKDLPGAEKEIKKAIALKESSATAHLRYSIYLRDQGRLSEALAEVRRAYELDPVSLTIGSNLAFIHYLRRDYDQAAICARRVLETEPDYFQSLVVLGPTLQQQRKHREAIALLEKLKNQQHVRASVYYNALEALGNAYAGASRRDAAERMVAELKACPEDEDETTYRQALIHAGLGELDEALALLEAISGSWNFSAVELMLDPRFDNLRADPRYESVMKKRFGFKRG